jgi:type III pantothenate kinase
MILCVDIGNTHIHLGLFIRAALRKTWTIASKPQRTCDEYALLLRGLLGEGLPLQSAIIASVVPRLEWPMAQAIEQEFKTMPVIMDDRTPTGLINGYEHPSEVGMDRLANAVGAEYFHGAPVLILDFGTAITLDYLAPTPLGETMPVYMGGAILPGIEMAAESLARNTAKLPRVALMEPRRAIGRTTAESIQAGLLHGYTGAITTLVERAREELNDNVEVIATGGDVMGLKDHLPFISAVHPELTLYGLRQILGHSIGDMLPPRREENN